VKLVTAYCLAMALGAVAVLLLLDGQESRRRQGELLASLRDAEQRESIAQARYAEAVTDKETVTVRVTRWATRYDSLRAVLRTRQASGASDSAPKVGTIVPESGTVGDSLPDYRRVITPLIDAADSAIAACRDLVSSCERLKLAADSSIVALTAQADAYKQLWEREKSSRWDKAKPWVFGAAGLYVGLKLRGP
jgi:hypothetical protein